MTVNTKSMREFVDAAPGSQVVMDKEHLHRLLDVVDAGQSAALALAGLSRFVPTALAA